MQHYIKCELTFENVTKNKQKTINIDICDWFPRNGIKQHLGYINGHVLHVYVYDVSPGSSPPTICFALNIDTTIGLNIFMDFTAGFVYAAEVKRFKQGKIRDGSSLRQTYAIVH
jgi:hypothetical protein